MGTDLEAAMTHDDLDTERLVGTRRALHGLAEHLLAGDLARRTGKIGLRPTPGGFGQPEVLTPTGRRRLRVDGTHLVVLDGDAETWHPLTTAGALAEAAGAELGAPGDPPETAPDATAALDVDAASAEALAGWWRLVAEALEVVRRAHRDQAPTVVQIWPEHFDVACSVGEVNLGGSPGDDDHPEPYLYVGPWQPRAGEFWNEPWGASRSWRHVPTVADAVAFLEDGLARTVAGD